MRFFKPFLLLLLPLLVHAQEDIRRPVLNGHEFVPISSNTDPFIISDASMSVGAGLSDVVVWPIIFIDDEPVLGAQGRLGMIDYKVAYQQRAKDWLAFRMKISGSARVGTGLQSILAQGISTVSGIELGWLIRIKEGQKHSLSFSTTLSNRGASITNVTTFIEEIINDMPNPRIQKRSSSLMGNASLHYAWGISSVWGLKSTFKWGYGESFALRESINVLTAGLVVDANFYKKSDTPIGLAFAQTFSSSPDVVHEVERMASSSMFKIAYTGSSDFSIGLELSYARVPVTGLNERISVIGAAFTSRYYF